jgi:hypothetical protein
MSIPTIITETRITKRLDVSVPFFGDTEACAILDPNIIAVNSPYHTILSEDRLTQTITREFDGLDQYNRVLLRRSRSVQLDVAFLTYNKTHGIYHGGYTLTGIDVPFTVTTTYTFLSDAEFADAVAEQVAQLAENIRTGEYVGCRTQSATKLINLVVNTESIVATHQYNNSADYSATRWEDFLKTSDLTTVSCTRTIQFALV